MDKKRLPIHSPRLGLQPSVRKLSIITTFVFHYHLPILTTESQVPTTDHRVPSTDHRVPSTDHRSLSTDKYNSQVIWTLHQWIIHTNTIHVHLKYRVLGLTLDTWWFVQWVKNGHVVYIFSGLGLRFSALRTRHSALDDLCNVNEKWTCCTLGFKFCVSALKTRWFVQWVKNGHVVYIFSGLRLWVSALGTWNSMICVM